jgi:predicted esterase
VEDCPPADRLFAVTTRLQSKPNVRQLAALAAVSCWVLAAAVPVRADEPKILDEIRSFFATQDADRREELARAIESDPAFDRAKVSTWLHRAVPFETLEPGPREIQVPLTDGQSRTVALRIPEGYDPHKPWPLIYALHGTGGSGPNIINYLQQVLGKAVDNYVIAAPTGYAEAGIEIDHWPPIREHPANLLAIKRSVNVDSDRVFVCGYSLGGHATWTLSILHADQFAGGIAVAGTFLLPEDDGLWDVFLPNIAHLHMLSAWGANDVTGPDMKTRAANGGIAGLNRKLRALAEKLKITEVAFEDPDKGHGDIDPPHDLVAALLENRREHYPENVHHAFRHIYQAQAYWLEGHIWTGPQWTDKQFSAPVREGETVYKPEDVKKAAVRAYRALFGELSGEISGQSIVVHRKKVSELTIWIGDGMIDWTKPVNVKVSGEKSFDGELKPDLFVCLTQAARTYDFERLRWAGLRFKSGKKLEVVTGRTTIPPIETPMPKADVKPPAKPPRKPSP